MAGVLARAGVILARDSTTRTDDLIASASQRFGELSEAELRLLRAAPVGDIAYCGPSSKSADSTNDPAGSNTWGPERGIRAELIRWLCRDQGASRCVDSRGIRVCGAAITGKVDLSFATAGFPFLFWRCHFSEDLDLMYANVPALNLTGSRISSLALDGAVLPGSVVLRAGFLASGEVRLLGVQIGRDLDCNGGTFRNPGGMALGADGARVGGGVNLGRKFSAEGEVRLLGAHIGGNLTCSGGTFCNRGAPAFAGDGIKVAGTAFLNTGFLAEGEVRLLMAEIGNNLDCTGGKFRNPTGIAIFADGAQVGNGILLKRGFSAEGETRLLGAVVGGNVECDRGTFMNAEGWSINAENAKVEGSIFLTRCSAPGGVLLFGVQLGGGLQCRGGVFGPVNLNTAKVKGILLWSQVQNAHESRLDLRNASVGPIEDDEQSWPQKGNLALDGFVYAGISEGPRDAETRVKWLERTDSFTLQPYRQLAKVLHESGDERGARRVLYEMEDRRRKEQDRTWFARSWSLILRRTIGYGHMSWWALVWLVALALAGAVLFGLGYLGGAIAPNEEKAYSVFEQRGYPPDYYPQFNPIVYSFEHSFPLINLGVKDHWAPRVGGSTSPPALRWRFLLWMRDARFCGVHPLRWNVPVFLRLCSWLEVPLGWGLATLFVAGLTGVVKAGP